LSQDRIHRTIRSATDATPEKEATMLLRALFLSSFIILSVSPHTQAQTTPAKIDLAQPQDYVLKRTSSFDRSGGNADFRKIPPGQTLTILDVDGPATLTHIWFTLSSREATHLKKLVLRMYWDHESTPSVETPLGDFFGLGLGDYYTWESELLAVAHEHALNSFFPMPFQKHALVTVTNEGQKMVDAFYFNLGYRALLIGFPCMTVGLILGIVLAQATYHTIDFLDPIFFLSILMWFVYLLLVYTRWNAGWRGRRVAYLAAGAFVVAVLAWCAN